MLTIKKHDIANILMLNKLAEIRNIEDKIKFFAKKYNMSFKDFISKIQKSKIENFEEWDDSMEWEALVNVHKELSQNIRALKSGHFRVS